MIDIATSLSALAIERPVFHSEADFQHALAWHIHTIMPEARVRPEYRPRMRETLYLDILARTVDGDITLELKYPTRKLECEIAGEGFALKDQSAQDLRRYDFIKDVARLERIVDAFPGMRGYALLLTNDSSYWGQSFSSAAIDAAFRIHEGANLAGTLAWASHAGTGTMTSREQPLTLRGTYPVEWRDYSVISGGKSYNRFRYLLVPVESHTSIDRKSS